MYTILITNDNSVIATEKDTIMEKSNLVDVLQFIVEKEYNGYDMATFDLYIEGYAPITHEIHLEKLTMTDNNYKELYYAYQLPVDTRITQEAGNLLYSLKFLKSELDTQGNIINRVRHIQQGSIDIVPISNWFTAPDSALDTLTQILLANQQNISALKTVADTIVKNAPEDIKLDTNSDEIYLTNDRKRLGTGITIGTLRDALGLIEIDDSPEKTTNYLTVEI